MLGIRVLRTIDEDKKVLGMWMGTECLGPWRKACHKTSSERSSKDVSQCTTTDKTVEPQQVGCLHNFDKPFFAGSVGGIEAVTNMTPLFPEESIGISCIPKPLWI